jgi:hypothetical protein
MGLPISNRMEITVRMRRGERISKRDKAARISKAGFMIFEYIIRF